jgi:hypothetical protein
MGGRDGMQNETIIFLHIPKTAGTTLRRIIDRQYRPQEIYSTDPTPLQPSASLEAFKQLSTAERAQIRLLRGHLPFGVHTFVPGPSTYFTVLRDPVERVLSYYYFTRRFSPQALRQHVNTPAMTLPRFVESQAFITTRNLQTRLLAGMGRRRATTKDDEEILALAKKNLQEAFTVVGLTERFDETLLLLKNAFHWRHIFYVKLNVTRRRPTQHATPPEIRQVIRADNHLDLELHRYALDLFEEQIQRQGPDFAEQLRMFQLRNRLLQPFLHIRWRATTNSVRKLLGKVGEITARPRAV